MLSGLKRRNSGRRNLHKPWTEVEEAELVRLAEQADYRKQVKFSLTLCMCGSVDNLLIGTQACSIPSESVHSNLTVGSGQDTAADIAASHRAVHVA